MKYLLTAFAILFILGACQKEINGEFENNPNDTTIVITEPASFEAKIDSVQWEADTYGAAFSTPTPLLPRLFNLTGTSLDGSVLTITLVDSGVHYYTLNNTSMNAAAYSHSSDTADFTTNQGPDSVVAGSVTITKIDTVNKTVSGVFSFRVYRDIDSTHKDFTDGTFTNIPYSSGNIIPPATSTDTFHVKINDTLFTPYSINGNLIALNHSIAIQGSDSLVTKTVGFNVPDTVKPGTYTFDNLNYVGVYNYNSNLSASSGTIQILAHDTVTNRIKGNFQFHAKDLANPSDSAVLTEGYFSVIYH